MDAERYRAHSSIAPNSTSLLPDTKSFAPPQLACSPAASSGTVIRSSQLRPRLNFRSLESDYAVHSSDEDDLPETVYDDNWASLIREAEQQPETSCRPRIPSLLPSRFIPDPSISGITVRFIMSQYEPLFELIIFKPVQFQMKILKSRFIMRIISSNVVHWSMYLGARIFQSLVQDGELANIHGYLPWLDRFDKLCITSNNNQKPEDLVDRLSGGLELAFLRYITSNTTTGYTLVRRLAPTFLQLALADPLLRSRNPMLGCISLAHTLVSSRFELVRFTFMDAISSLILGVPPLVEYDTSHPPVLNHEPHPMEWVHGCPAELIIVVVRINMWRARNLGTLAHSNNLWRELEEKTWAWRSRGDYGQERNSWRLITRLAIQEGWRHAVLIYIYLGMCGLASHDSRVQSSTRQIGRLLTTIQSDTAAGIHFFVPAMTAAICTRYETQRGRFRNAILKSGNNKPWLLRGEEFAAVLDRLWHGAAANGQAVTWKDYIKARKATFWVDDSAPCNSY